MHSFKKISKLWISVLCLVVCITTASILFLISKKEVTAAENSFRITVPVWSNPTQLKLSNRHESITLPIEKTEFDGISKVAHVTMPTGLETGKYQLELLTATNSVIYTQDFTWGVLALNTTKDIYLPEEQINTHIAVLDPKGNMVCDADVLLELVDEQGTVLTHTSTQENSIAVTQSCLLKSYTAEPDYSSQLKAPKTPGTYTLKLTAKTKQGEYTTNTRISVVDQTPTITVERRSATRIYPFEVYPMELIVHSTTDQVVTITDTVPADFLVTIPENAPNAFIEKTEKHIRITWQQELKKDQELVLRYTYDTPDKSPYFYQIGPWEIKAADTALAFHEQRTWQLAIDAIAFEEVDTGTDNTSATSVTTGTNSTAVDNQLYVAIITIRGGVSSNSLATTSVSGLGLTWTGIEEQCSARGTQELYVFRAIGNTNDTDGTVTATFTSAPTGSAIAVLRYSDVNTTTPIGNTTSANTLGVNGACTGGTDTNSPSVSLTTGSNDSYVLGAIAHRNRTLTAGSGYTERADFNSGGTAGNEAGVAAEDKLQATADTVTINGTTSGTTDWAIAGIEINKSVSDDITVGTTGTQATELDANDNNKHVGGAFVFTDVTGSRNLTGITIQENGTVNAQTYTSNVKLYYENDTSAPYDCASESYGGSESQFGSTTSFNGADGTASFTGSVAMSTTSTVCVYPVLDIEPGFTGTPTLELKVDNPSTAITISSGTITSTVDVDISGSTTLYPDDQIYHRSTSTHSAYDVNGTLTQLVTSSITAYDNQLYIVSIETKNTDPIASVTGMGLTWTQIKTGSATYGTQCSSRGQQGISMWYAIGDASDGAITINVTNAEYGIDAAVSRYSGTDIVDPIGAYETANTSGVDSSVCTSVDTNLDTTAPSVTITTTQDNSYVVAGIAKRANTVSGMGSGYTQRATVNNTSSGGLFVMDKATTTLGSQTASATINVATDWSIMAVEVKTPTDTVDVANLCVYREQTAAETITTSAIDLGWDTSVVQDPDTCVIQANTYDVELQLAGHYLALHNAVADSASGSDTRSSVESWLRLNNTTNLAYGYAGGYMRRSNNNNEAYLSGATILAVSADDDIRVQTQRTDTGSGTASRRAATSGMQFVKLNDSWDYARVSKSSNQGIGSDTNFSTVTFDTSDELDTGSFTRSSGDITLKVGGYYLVTYNVGVTQTDTTNPSNSEARLTLDGTEIDGTRVSAYMGAAESTTDSVASWVGIIRTSKNDQVLRLQARRESNTSVTGHEVAAAKTALTAVRLPSSADVVRLGDTSGTQDLSTSRTTLTFNQNTEVESPSFSYAGGNPSRVEIDTAGNYLFLQSSLATRGSGSTIEAPFLEWRVSGTDVRSYGGFGFINTATQNSVDAFSGGGSGGILLHSLANTDYVEITQTNEATNDNATYTANRVSMQGINLDTLLSATYDTPANADFMRHGTWFNDAGAKQPASY